MKIKAQEQTAITFDAQEFAAFVEQVRHAYSVALGDLLALGMPSPATSTGKLLLAALDNIEAIQKEMLDGTPETEGYSVEKEKFGDLKIGERFICWPMPGDNSGHGGYKGQHRLFVKTNMNTKDVAHSGLAENGSDVESTFPHSMTVIRVILT